ncbi:hypothetical protein GUJ93_ZPchr0011g28279 [Zizania palustris]|uniref:Uncharacterized protein n=1 Tax=Zizania palustris TaxID=103762 RepID=A0A8J5WL12_ZIZPA|nr:hypothetical protein GUJ93_ZPchr0011g28279 [Zizania palustris]
MSPGRRLGVLRSHLQAGAPSLPAGEGNRQVSAEQGAGVSTSPCVAAAGGRGEIEGKESCVFCWIIRGEAPAFKVRFPRSVGVGGVPLVYLEFSVAAHFPLGSYSFPLEKPHIIVSTVNISMLEVVAEFVVPILLTDPVTRKLTIFMLIARC